MMLTTPYFTLKINEELKKKKKTSNYPFKGKA